METTLIGVVYSQPMNNYLECKITLQCW